MATGELGMRRPYLNPALFICLNFQIHLILKIKHGVSGRDRLTEIGKFSYPFYLHLIFVFIFIFYFYFYYIKINIFHKK